MKVYQNQDNSVYADIDNRYDKEFKTVPEFVIYLNKYSFELIGFDS